MIDDRTEEEFYFETFKNEKDLEPIIKLVEKDLSEPYSIYTFRFFIYDFPKMCIMVKCRFFRKDSVFILYFSVKGGIQMN
jgi:hypothetical protein